MLLFKSSILRGTVLLCSLLTAIICLPLAQADNSLSPAMGYSTLNYDLPKVGSYQLPTLGKAADGKVIDSDGKATTLHELYKGQYTLLGFIYSNCGDINGCPLSSYVFYKVKSMMQKDPQLADKLRLLSLSFDPERDTPEVMKLYGNNFNYAGPEGDWHFLTTKSEQALSPLLRDYKQDIQREMTVNGTAGDSIAHVLRVFLIDPENNIRNIYSVEFLHPDIILNDLKTLLRADEELQTSGQSSVLLASNSNDAVLGSSISSEAEINAKQSFRTTTDAPLDLLSLAKKPPLGLPRLPEELVNSLSRKKIALGRKLFFDRRLSLNSTMSCAMCHVPNQGFTSNEIATAVGFEGRSVRRNSPSLYNIAYAETLFHDAREDSLSQQVWAPFLARNEMANPSVGYVVNKLKALPDYSGLFEAAFSDQKRPINIQTIGDALAAYQQTLISADSPFDRWHFGKESPAQAGISTEAIKGFELFKGKAGCVTCHQIDENSALFTNQGIHNTGLGYENSMGKKPKKQKVMLAPGVFVDVDQSIIDNVGEKPAADLGHYEISQDPKDRWKYKTPMLRNVELSAPYMHDGSFSTLQSVVEFYNQGGIENPGLDPLIRPLGLNETEISQIVAFMKSLTGNNVDQMLKDASAAPIGDTSKQDLLPLPAAKENTKKVPPLANKLGGDFQLTDHNGNHFDLKQLRGKISLLFFGYTHCPDVCPTELANMARLLKQLDTESDNVQGLFVSVDPTRDTPERLSQYVPYFHPKLIGLTGSAADVKTVTSAYKVHSNVQKTEGKDLQYLVDHSANLFIIDGNGKLAQIVPFGFPQAHILEAVKRSIATLDSTS